MLLSCASILPSCHVVQVDSVLSGVFSNLKYIVSIIGVRAAAANLGIGPMTAYMYSRMDAR